MALFDHDEHTLYAPTPHAARESPRHVDADDGEPVTLRAALTVGWNARVLPAPARRVTPKQDPLATQRVAAARDDHERKKAALDSETLQLRLAEAAFRTKYRWIRPPEAPRGPVRSVGV